MSEQIPVNPVMLRWARETGGFDIEDVVIKLKRKRITSETVASWEEGTESPTYVQLERLAYEIYKRPLALFFFPEPPEEETSANSFRTLPQKEINLLKPRLLYLVRQAKAMQENLKELFDGVNPAKKQACSDITIHRSDTISDVAKMVREYLDAGLNKQYALTTNDKALKYWRNVLEKHGVFIFKDAFKSDECSGFCLYDDVFPIIYINNSQAKIRQIFTLFHELAHLLFRTGGIDLMHDDFVRKMTGYNKHVEVFCNKFAGEFLVPAEDIKPRIHNQTIDDKLITLLAKKYSVSREVILRKCLDLNYITNEFYKAKVKEWNEERRAHGDSGSGGNPYNTKGAYLGSYYIETAFGKYYQGAISKTQLADYLGMKETHVSTFEGYVVPDRKPRPGCFGNDEGIPETSEFRRFGNSLRSFPKQNFGFPFRHYVLHGGDAT
ncbi:MAG: ImmA/IrrE family metallo-endopeptidase [Gammaproteobacteria bacterium]|nr:ImmA/IrrE family metallo-endopeptidase [Gammaproteobacteria bacterium]